MSKSVILPETLEVIDKLYGLNPRIGAVDDVLLDAVFRAWSENTRRAFRSDITLWLRWCHFRRIFPPQASSADVARWIGELAEGKGVYDRSRAPATIKRYLVHVGRAYRLAKLSDPTSDDLVLYEMRAAFKKLGKGQKQAQGLRYKGDISDFDSPAAPLSLVTLLKACKRGIGRLDALALRDIALLRTAYDTGLRRAELVRIEVVHIDGPDDNGAGRLFIPNSKTDQMGEGAYAYLSSSTMQALGDWFLAAGRKRGPVFSRIRTYSDGSVSEICEEALHPQSISLIYKRLVRRAHEMGFLGDMPLSRLEKLVADISSHSIRVGVAQDCLAAGEDIGAIMQSYRWKDPRTVLRYGAKLCTRSGASARMAKRLEI